MSNLALFVLLSYLEDAIAVMATLFEGDQSGSFNVRLSANGQEPATHLGGFARGLDAEQVVMLTASPTIHCEELGWPVALAAMGLVRILEES